MADLPGVPAQRDLRREARHAQLTPQPRPRATSRSVDSPPCNNRTPRTSAIGCRRASRGVFGQTLPALLGALVILFAGYLLAKVLEKLTERGLRRIRLNQLLVRGGVIQAVERSGTHVNPTRVLANLVFWLVMFTVILLAANALGLDSLANVVSTLVSYIPSVIAAIVIILVGHRARRIRRRVDRRVGGRGSRRTRAGAHRTRRRDPARDFHGAAGARHRDGHRHDGVRDSVRRDRARAGARRSASAIASSRARSRASGTSGIAASAPKRWRASEQEEARRRGGR